MDYAVRIGALSMDDLDDLPGITQISWRSPASDSEDSVVTRLAFFSRGFFSGI